MLVPPARRWCRSRTNPPADAGREKKPSSRRRRYNVPISVARCFLVSQSRESLYEGVPGASQEEGHRGEMDLMFSLRTATTAHFQAEPPECVLVRCQFLNGYLFYF